VCVCIYMCVYVCECVCVCSPNPRPAHLCECHAGDDGQHDLLPLGGVGVLLVLLQPGLQGAGGLPRGGLGPGRVPVRVLAVRVEALSGVDRQRGQVGARAVLQLVLGALQWYGWGGGGGRKKRRRRRGDNLLSDWFCLGNNLNTFVHQKKFYEKFKQCQFDISNKTFIMIMISNYYDLCQICVVVKVVAF